MQSVFNEKFYFLVSEPLNVPLIFDRFWPIWWIEKKIIVKDIIFDSANKSRWYLRGAALKYCITDETGDDILWQDEDYTDPFNDEDAEVVDEEGELNYAEQGEMSTVELDESDYHSIFGNSDHENDFEGF